MQQDRGEVQPLQNTNDTSILFANVYETNTDDERYFHNFPML